MLRNLYILSEGSWGIKSAEIFADLFYFLSLSALLITFFVTRPDLYGIPAAEILVLFLVFWYLLQRNKSQNYLIAHFSQYFLLLLVLPIAFLQPVLIFLAVVCGSLLQMFLLKKYFFRLQLLIYLFFFFFCFDAILTFTGFPQQIVPPSSFQLPIFSLVETKTLGPLFSMPLLPQNNFNVTDFRSSFEFLSTFILVAISLVAFRRPVLLLYFVGWVGLYFCYGFSRSQLPMAVILNLSSIAFLIHIAPGRNFYGSFYLSIITFLVLMPIAWLVGRFGGQPIFVLMLFFPLEAIFIRVFLGK